MSRFRRASASDAPAITALVNLAYRVEDFFKTGDRTTEAEVRELMRDGLFLVAGDSHGLAGTVHVRVGPPRGYFGMLSVHPEHQGSGLGRALIEAAEELCSDAGCEFMELWVVNLREELPPWYERLGYTVSGEEPWPEEALDELSRPAHFIRMSKPLARVAAAGGMARG